MRGTIPLQVRATSTSFSASEAANYLDLRTACWPILRPTVGSRPNTANLCAVISPSDTRLYAYWRWARTSLQTPSLTPASCYYERAVVASRSQAVDMDKLPSKDFPPDESLWDQTRPDGEAPWTILSSLEENVMDKMLAKGTPLGMWDVRINYGIETGYNDAFIIDDATRRALIAEDPNSAEIIKPILRGQDIQRYKGNWRRLWLIATFPSLHLDINHYPAVKVWLRNFLPKLDQTGAPISNDEKQSLIQRMTCLGLKPKERDLKKCRKETTNSWFELQDTCAYHDEFTKEKLFWMHMAPRGRFAYSDSGTLCNQKAFIVTGNSIKYLCAILNSKLITWLVKNTAVTTGMGLTQWGQICRRTPPRSPKFPPPSNCHSSHWSTVSWRPKRSTLWQTPANRKRR